MQHATDELWYKNAIVYAVDVETFQDSDGDGIGDFRGLIDRIPYLVELGITCVWLLPFYPTPNRDNGYDIQDYFEVDPSHGTLEDLIEFIRRAGEHGIRVILDLVVNHTSDRHPWFQAARRDPRSRYRDYYVWTSQPPPTDPSSGTIFPGQESSVWTYDEIAGEYYYHRFYAFEPELRIENEQVREEIARILDFWLCFGVAGFRVDAASHMIEAKGLDSTRPADPHGVLKDLRRLVSERRPGTVLIGESDVDAARLQDYFGEGDELNLLFNFFLDNYLFLAFARQDAAPVEYAIGILPAIPHQGQWANFLRNLDELDLERLPEEEREEVYRAFAPEEDMRIFGRGIRRRLAPMFGGDPRRLRMAYSLLFSLPGSPVFVYGDEIGMGEDLSLQGRTAVRTPMQWSDSENAGFSGAAPEALAQPIISEGSFGYGKVNVEAQRGDPGSLLEFVKRLVRVRRQTPEFGWGAFHVVPNDHDAVLAHRAEWRGGHMLAIHNLSAEAAVVTLDFVHQRHGKLHPVLGEAEFELESHACMRVEMEPYGYLWLREGPPGSQGGAD